MSLLSTGLGLLCVVGSTGMLLAGPSTVWKWIEWCFAPSPHPLPVHFAPVGGRMVSRAVYWVKVIVRGNVISRGDIGAGAR